MYKSNTVFLILLLLNLSSCTNSDSILKNSHHETAKTLVNKNSINKLIKSMEDSIPPTFINKFDMLSFKFNVDSIGNTLKSIIIYSKNSVLQKIIANKDIAQNKFELIDWNFDGHKDISVRSGCGSGGCTYWIWNYSPEKKKYLYNSELSEAFLELDSVNKFIIFHNRAGFNEEIWDSFQYINYKLTFIKGMHQERWNDENGMRWEKHTYTKLMHNKLVTKADSNVITK